MRRLVNFLDAGDRVALENSVDDVHPLDHLTEHRVVAAKPGVVAQVDEPLPVARVVAARAHADRASRVWYRPQLVAEVARVPDVLVVAVARALDHEIRLDTVPSVPVIVAG